MNEEIEVLKDEITQDTPLKIDGGTIPLQLHRVTYTDGSTSYYATVDGVEWFDVEALHHAAVLYAMMKDHLTEYMHYKAI